MRVLLFVLVSFAVHPASAAQNVVLILTDDQGWTGTSVRMMPSRADSHSDFYRTPAIERLAAQGMRFSQAYAPHPNCSPTRLAIQVGKSPAQMHMTDIINRGSGIFYEGLPMIPPQHIDNIPEDEQTIAELLKQADPSIATAHFGKWHLGGGGPGSHGYDEHDGPTSNREGGEGGDNPKRIFGITSRANDFLERKARAGERFFLQISHYAAHLPVRHREETADDIRKRQRGAKHDHVGHAAMIRDLDTGIGAVLDKIDALGLRDDTYVVFTSDNGSYFDSGDTRVTNNLPLHGQKASVWEGGIRVPLVVRGPGVASGVTSDALAIGYDLYATIPNMFGIKAELPHAVEGGSLLPVLLAEGEGAVKRVRDELVWHFPHYQTAKGTTPMSAIRKGDWKLIHWWTDGESKLFDLSKDLGEQNDLAAKQPKRTQAMEQRLRAHLKQIGAPMAKPNPDYASESTN